jgi:hypothetical protein
MDVFGGDIVAKIKRDQIEEIQVHGIVRKNHVRDLIYATMFEIQFGNSQMMGEGIFADRRNKGENSG